MISPRRHFFFTRPPRRTTRFTDRNEQPAVKVDVHVLLACRLRDNPRFTEQRLTPGEENSPRSGKRKRSLKQVESVLKKEKKRLDRLGHLPGFLCARNRGKRGEERRNSRSVIFIAVSAFCLFCLSVSRRTSCFHVSRREK